VAQLATPELAVCMKTFTRYTSRTVEHAIDSDSSLTNAELLEKGWLCLVLEAISSHDDIRAQAFPAAQHYVLCFHSSNAVHLACDPACLGLLEYCIIRLPCMARAHIYPNRFAMGNPKAGNLIALS